MSGVKRLMRYLGTTDDSKLGEMLKNEKSGREMSVNSAIKAMKQHKKDLEKMGK